ncbi:MurT ligase domain-containing protein [Neobacillus sp. PS3-12]|uniref:MurT ligase domain-containing protein n=1 Tax=Neobacillus sp. PS3-12 TaxID=3070677 RepID=UPI0027E08C57|nr:MurT ligase domain-containing protein [Neobacillus sp. PS3-12]WML53650.1 MurT ligase domain-containing protein [Neobacillus sp. PS3-12]
MRTRMAIWSGKMAGILSKSMGNDGTTIPGVVARKVDPLFLRHLRKTAKTIIYITGTNGKTTTANLAAHLLRFAGKKVIANLEGSNMVTGLSAALVRQTPLVGWRVNEIAVMEVDEASLPKVVSECAPDYLIVTNFFRDQLDRYGEVDLLIKKMKESLRTFDIKLILNGDDPFVHRFSSLQKENIYVGLDANACPFQSYSMAESKYCPECQNELTYTTIHYGQLGHYKCSCGFSRPEPNFSVEKVENGIQGVRLSVDGVSYPTTLKGMYNAYNALLAITMCRTLGIDSKYIQDGLVSYHKGNGRMQEFSINGVKWKLNLVKNPAGANVTLSEYMLTKEKKQFIFCLNDELADGEDISWIWDIDLEMANRSEVDIYIASGKRAYDVALRMKYAGIPSEKIMILPNLKEAVFYTKSKALPTYVMATYTCLSPLISILSRETDKLEKGDENIGTATIPLLPRYLKPVWGQRKYHMFKKTMRMAGNYASSRRNK